MESRPSKRVKLSPEPGSRPAPEQPDPASIRSRRAAFLSSITRSISPPVSSRSGPATPQPRPDVAVVATKADFVARVQVSQTTSVSTPERPAATVPAIHPEETSAKQPKLIASPFKLTKIPDLPASNNIDTVSLHDILGNPLIKEAWIFNYCFDVDWFLNFFDADIRSQVKVKVIHGSWKKEDANKQAIDDACRRWENVEAATAYLPDPFGTHHSKMIVLFTHDDMSQVVIHTANMLAQDWTNLTQAAWMSPTLPLLAEKENAVVGKIGSGSRFKHDLQAYLAAYGSKTKALRDLIAQFDFSSVRGALIASVPSHMKDYSITKDANALLDQKLWGYPSLHRALSSILPRQQEASTSHIVCQISSIATLPQTWLNQFFPFLYGKSTPESTQQQLDSSRVSIIYPTPSNVASSLNGYASGGSIHTKAQSPAHLKQISSLRSSLCQWKQVSSGKARAGRHEAAPHIKTYVSFAAKPTQEKPVQDVQWALLTSANLSQQAWGTLRETGKGKHKEKEVVVQSYEIGVLVWPGLFAEDFDTGDEAGTSRASGVVPRSSETIRMVPVFGKDVPTTSEADIYGVTPTADTIVGLRLPYDLPLTPYAASDMPWSPQGTYQQPDRFGRSWV
ncbi:hypothetical protein H2200_006119 [Cladophialophora chaetospira]|uniref:Tyrosyl-DNA phosphodiesterase n=1 Tax=Cladophialophora chaetospira TaxID=386627 RepID=A0AA38XAG6_9EURO|nr:hypothetical protein H2200_006119 [Cladophialophora chaetospira]